MSYRAFTIRVPKPPKAPRVHLATPKVIGASAVSIGGNPKLAEERAIHAKSSKGYRGMPKLPKF